MQKGHTKSQASKSFGVSDAPMQRSLLGVSHYYGVLHKFQFRVCRTRRMAPRGRLIIHIHDPHTELIEIKSAKTLVLLEMFSKVWHPTCSENSEIRMKSLEKLDLGSLDHGWLPFWQTERVARNTPQAGTFYYKGLPPTNLLW